MFPYAFYLLKVTVCSGILFGYYRLLLRNKIFHSYNRFYLLASILLSLVLPLITINIWHAANAPTPIKLLQVINNDEYLDEIVVIARQNSFTAEQALMLFYCVTTVVFFGLFIGMLTRIRMLFVKHRHSLVEDIYFVNTTAKGTPFSFLKYIFWNDHIDPESATGNRIFKHELAHVQQKHSYDKLFINVVLIFCWCNPFFWLMRRELNMIHEFIADKIAVEDSDTETFAAMILKATYPQHRFQLTNPFFYSPIKRRLLMLAKNENTKAGYIGRILVLPLAVLVFAAFTLKAKTIKHEGLGSYNGKKITVVIDAGHGGADNGAVSLAGNIFEKDITLAIIKKIKALNRNASLNIILTRESDVFQTPNEKGEFTKQQQADLFISIHTDGTSKEKAGRYSGMSVWVAKDNFANADNSKLFASAILNEFSNNYQLPVTANPQQRKTGIAVLQASSCPSVLIEAGYITNSHDLLFLQSAAAQETIATRILSAVEKYAFAKDKTEPGIAMRTISVNENFPGEKTDTVPRRTLKNLENVLIIVDGKPSTQPELEKIAPSTITSIHVLKDEASMVQYGAKGKNGVILVETKPTTLVLNYNDGQLNYKADTSVRAKEKATNLQLEPNRMLLNLREQKTNETDTTPKKSNSEVKIKLRNTQDPSSQPLFVIDGQVKKPGFDIKEIPADNIESITVLKDQTATNRYGSQAVNGVIEITTKNKKEIPVSEVRSNNIGTTVVRYNHDQEQVNAVYTIGTASPTNLHLIGTDASNTPQEQINKVFTKVEYEPAFPGGDTAWRNYLVRNLKADMPLREGWKPGTYKIVLTFIVKADGSITDIKADNYAGTKTAEHCIDLIKNGPKWLPAKQNGLTVNCYRKQPISFVVGG